MIGGAKVTLPRFPLLYALGRTRPDEGSRIWYPEIEKYYRLLPLLYINMIELMSLDIIIDDTKGFFIVNFRFLPC